MVVVLTASFDDAAQTDFFTKEMKLHPDVYAALAEDGIDSVNSLAEQTAESISQLRKEINKDTTVTKKFGLHSEKRLIVAIDAVKFCIAVKRPISPAMFKWDPILATFKETYGALKALKEKDPQAIPRLTKSFGPIRWAPAFQSVLGSHFSTCTDCPIPLAYLLRDNPEAADPPPPLEPGHLHSIEHGSPGAELIARASHRHPGARADIELLQSKMEEATRGTQYSTAVAATKRNGCKAFKNIKSQHLGNDKWSAEIKKHDALLRDLKWKGTGNQTLEKFISLHRQSYQALENASQHLEYQLPTPYTRVGYLINNIETTDANLAAAIAQVKADKAPNGQRNTFELAAATIQEACPVAAKQQSSKRAHASIAATEADETITIAAAKAGIGKTGVHFRFYKPHEWRTLQPEQKQELIAWRQTPEGIAATAKSKADGESRRKAHEKKAAAKRKARISALVDEAVQAKISALTAPAPTPAPAPAPSPAGRPNLVDPATLQAALVAAQAAQSAQVSGLSGHESGKLRSVNWATLPGIIKRAKNGKSAGS